MSGKSSDGSSCEDGGHLVGCLLFRPLTHIEQAAIKMDFFFFQCCYAYRGEKGSSQANLLSQKQVALAKNNPRNICYK